MTGYLESSSLELLNDANCFWIIAENFHHHINLLVHVGHMTMSDLLCFVVWSKSKIGLCLLGTLMGIHFS